MLTLKKKKLMSMTTITKALPIFLSFICFRLGDLEFEYAQTGGEVPTRRKSSCTSPFQQVLNIELPARESFDISEEIAEI
eukprot:m.200033 g.200033  ORF g.200033 m.200033 type:complete len:80 (+) comp15734_c0_seq10:3109-3348(+)